MKGLNSPIMLKYLEAYRKDPGSRVFAPLAESYRKLGMIDEALRVLKTGIRHHPTYVLGHLTLAHCYYDQNQFKATYDTLKPLLDENLDNIGLARLFSETCLKLRFYEEALDSFKYVLFLNPKEQRAIDNVKFLEELLLGEKSEYLIALEKSSSSEAVTKRPVTNLEDFADQWTKVDFIESTPPVPESGIREEIQDDWLMIKGPKVDFIPAPQAYEVPVVSETSFEMVEKVEELLVSNNEEWSDSAIAQDDRPVMTMSLVDLYLSQNMWEQAKTVLEEMKHHQPLDPRVQERLEKLALLQSPLLVESETLASDEKAGHLKLLDLVESKVHIQEENEEEQMVQDNQLQTAFALFLTLIRARALDFQTT